jgi:hypothetical protein
MDWVLQLTTNVFDNSWLVIIQPAPGIHTGDSAVGQANQSLRHCSLQEDEFLKQKTHDFELSADDPFTGLATIYIIVGRIFLFNQWDLKRIIEGR